MIRLIDILRESEEERNQAMVTGVAEILRGVEDMLNRKELAMQMMEKFRRESVNFNKQQFLTMCGIPASAIAEADSPTERTRRYNRKNKKKVRAYLRSTVNDRVARNRDRAKAVKKNGKAKMKNKDVHHPDGPHGGSWRSVKKDHGPDKKN
jgi:uncharacterized protein YifE (UPF0438 family)